MFRKSSLWGITCWVNKKDKYIRASANWKCKIIETTKLNLNRANLENRSVLEIVNLY